MKREEKKQQAIRKIMDSALVEFSQNGYGASSINTICATQNISKGIIYHYFDTKDSLFLACVAECFEKLSDYIQANISKVQGSAEECLHEYFVIRMEFFQKHSIYQRIFCEAIVSPPAHLYKEIQKQKLIFDTINKQILGRLLIPVSLRSDISKEDVIETFRSLQDFINAHYQITGTDTEEFVAREKSCQKLLNVLLYGIIERKEF